MAAWSGGKLSVKISLNPILNMMDASEKRYSTGIKQLDDLMQGGFLDNSVIMLEGDAGTGKTTFSMHYLFSGLEAGEKSIFVTVDETKKSMYRNMGKFGFELQKYEDSGNLVFHECNAQVMRESLDKGILGIEDRISDRQSKRIIIDNVTALALLYDTEIEQRSAVHTLFQKVKMWGLTAMIISEASEDGGNFGLKYLVDGWIRLYHRKLGQERIRSLEVRKMRGTQHDASEMVYKIESGGISLYPDERILSD